MRSIQPVRVNHINMVLEDFDAGIAHFRALYGADFIADLPSPHWHAGLFEIGRTIFEPFVPHDWLTQSRYGNHYIGIEYQADMDAVRGALADRAIRLTRDIGVAVHTNAADTLGVSFEFYAGEFETRTWDLLGGATMKSADYWRDEHPLGATGLRRYSIAVDDMDAAVAFLTGFLSAEVVGEEIRPAIGARVVTLRIAGSPVELMAPEGDGILRRHLYRAGPGIRSTVLGVRDIGQARRYFAQKGVTLVPGDSPGAWAVPAEANLGIVFEFAE